MAKYKYTALDKNHEKVEGMIDAVNHAQATEMLGKQGIRPLVLKEYTVGNGKGGLDFLSKFQKRVSLKDMVIFTRQMATMISAGVPIVRSLQTMANQTENKYFREVITDIMHSVEGGMLLSEAMAAYPRVFSEIFVNMIKSGEAAGILDKVLLRLALQVEKDASIRKKLRSASAYPLVLLGITALAFFIIMIVIMPKIGGILNDLSDGQAKLPPITVAMLAISTFMRHYFILVFIGMIGLGYGFMRYIRTVKGRLLWHGLLLRTPIVKTFISKVAVARFARTFASLMGAGVGLLNAIQVTSGAIGNDVIANELRAAADEVRAGKQLSTILAKSKHFPMIVPQMLAVGEETGQIDKVLVKVADFYEEEVDTMIDSLASIIEPLMIVILGGMVGLIAISVMGPIASLSSKVGG